MIIFFIRRYNDIDHLVPVIDKIASENNSQILVYSINPDLNIDDFRLTYLLKSYGIKTQYVHHNPYESQMSFLLRLTIFNPKIFKISKYLNYTFLNIILSYVHKFFRRLYGSKNFDEAIKRYFDIDWCKHFLRKNNAKVVAFDWVKKDQHIAGNMMHAAKDLEIKIFALPHGLNVMTSNLITWREFEQGYPSDKSEDFNLFDHFVVNNINEKNYYSLRGVPDRKINVLGSPRFSKQWREKYKNILIEKTLLPKKEKALKVVYFEHSNIYRGYEEETRKTIEQLIHHDFIDLIIKPHTRSNTSENPDFIKYVSSKQSFNLIKWCDVAIGVTSSIFIDVILEKKAFILPKYLTDNSSLYQEYNVCWEVSSYEELESALQKISLNPNELPYGHNEIDLFMKSTVYNFSEDVLSAYRDLLSGRGNFDKL